MEDQDSRAARLEPIEARTKRTKTAGFKRKMEKLRKWMVRNAYDLSDLRAFLNIAEWDAKTPEQKSAIGKRTSIVAALKRKYCQHTNKPPKLRASGRHAGQWCCPSCWEPVSAGVIRAWAEKSRPADDLVV